MARSVRTLLVASLALIAGSPLFASQAWASPTDLIMTVHFAVKSASASAAAIQRTAQIMQSRARGLGVSGATTTVSGRTISMALPKQVATATFFAALDAPAVLLFRPVLCGAPAYSGPGQGPSSALPACSPASRYPTLKKTSTGLSFPVPSPDGTFARYGSTAMPSDIEHPGSDVLLTGQGGRPAPRLVLGPSLANGSLMSSCRATNRLTGQWTVICYLTLRGAPEFSLGVGRAIGQMLAEDYDGTVLSSPILEATNLGGAFQLSSDFTETSATTIATDLSSGALPVAVEVR